MEKVSYIKKIKSNDVYAKVKIDPYNRRVWVLDFVGEANSLINKLISYNREYPIEKVLCTVREKERKQFERIGFNQEAKIDGFFNGETAYFLSNYLDKSRGNSEFIDKENEILNIALNFSTLDKETTVNEVNFNYTIETANQNDVEEMTTLYKSIFKTYPTPLENPDYIMKVMYENVLFKIVRYKGKIISAASADMNPEYLNAEITDCATYPEYRGKGLISKLMDQLESELIKNNYKTLYTIARAGVIGINRAFAKRGYLYQGRLINNCNIGGRFEDMNIWFKQVQ